MLRLFCSNIVALYGAYCPTIHIMRLNVKIICPSCWLKLSLLTDASLYKLNVHHLEHLVETVKNWSPLGVISLYHFENSNGEITAHNHSTGSVLKSALTQLLMNESSHRRAHAVLCPQEMRFVRRIKGSRYICVLFATYQSWQDWVVALILTCLHNPGPNIRRVLSILQLPKG